MTVTQSRLTANDHQVRIDAIKFVFPKRALPCSHSALSKSLNE
jgi:hypothetical protein